MAQMWPKELSDHVSKDPDRGAERDTFARLDEVLDDSFVVLYSVPYKKERSGGRWIDGECDFVVAHAAYGILFLEIKGGENIRQDPKRMIWTRGSKEITNPVKQAEDAKHNIQRWLRKQSFFRSHWINCQHGIIFPHSDLQPGHLGPGIDRGMICDRGEFDDDGVFPTWIISRLKIEAKPLPKGGLEKLVRLLVPEIVLEARLSGDLARDDNKLKSLTESQFNILESLKGAKRVTIPGGAGTGKTVLAMQEAIRCAKSGAHTLFVCFNRGLATDVAHRMQGCPQVTVRGFHQLCREMAGRDGNPLPKGGGKQLSKQDYPNALMKAFKCLPEAKYDAIIVDEGQDFLWEWWAALDEGLVNPYEGSILRVFYDDNQRVHGNVEELREELLLSPYRLHRNLRNTQQIHALVRLHYEGDDTFEASGPRGREVEWLEVDILRGLKRTVSRYVGNLVTKEEVSEGDIAVLVGSKGDIQELVSQKDDVNYLGKFPTTLCDEAPNNRIVVDSVRRFKGLERRIVILVETKNVPVDAREFAYVALSRARTLLVVVGSRDFHIEMGKK